MKKNLYKYYFLVLTLFLAEVSLGDLANDISRLVNKSDQKKVEYGICIFNAATGRELFESNKTMPLIPASNMKLVTSAAALEYLGLDFDFETKIGTCGEKLVIIGDGDPLLGDYKTNQKYSRSRFWPVDDIVETIRANNISQIGDIIIDTTVFDDQRVHPAWPADQLNQWYACEVSGLNFNTNCIEFEVTNKGGKATYSLEPSTGYLDISNQVKTISKNKTAVGCYRSNVENKVYLKGVVHKSAKFDVAIERPAGFFAYYLAEQLLKNGVTLTGKIIEGPLDKSCEFKLLKTYKTPIADVLERCNQDSLGLAAESLLKSIGHKAGNGMVPGSWNNGTEAVAKYLEKIGLSPTEFKIDDGSGLSRHNRLSANCLVSVLKDVYRDEKKKNLIESTLAIGGVTGTASKWFKESKYKGKIFLKTGYINGVRSYSGLCRTKSGDILFSVITNQSNGKSRDAMNGILMAIIDNYDN